MLLCFLHSFGGAFAYTCSAFICDVLKVPKYILIPSLCIFLVSLIKSCCIVGSHSLSLIYIFHSIFFRFCFLYFLPTTTLIVYNVLFTFSLTLLICFFQLNLQSSIIPRNWVLSLKGMVWFLSVIFIGSLFLSLFQISCLQFAREEC